MSDEAGRQAWLANMRAQFVGDGGEGYVMGGGYLVAQAETGGPGASSSILQPLPASAVAAAALLQPQCAVLQPLPAFAAGPAANFAGWQPVPRSILQPVPAAAGTAPLVTPAISVSSHSPESGGIGPSVSPLKLKQMEDETEEEAVPLGREQYTENSPSGKAHQREMRAPAAVWTTVKWMSL